MGSMSSPEDDRLYDTLFEISNDIRHKILLLLKEQPERVTQISNKLELISPEVSRHLTRLSDSELIQKDLDNYYHVTGYGLHILDLIGEMEFFTKNREYFVSHNALHIPVIFKQRLPELSKYQYVNNFMGFLNFIDEKIKEANEFVWLCIDQYPLIAIDSLLNAVERGVKVKIIEQNDLSGPTVAFEDKHLIALGSDTPDVIIKNHDRKDVYLFVSDVSSAVSFPTKDGFDYSGFIVSDLELDSWSEDIFNYYWENAQNTVPSLLKEYTSDVLEKGISIILDAHSDPAINSHAIQNAVDNFDEVILRGEFRLTDTGMRGISMGMSTTVIKIRKSVVVRGEGREDDIPSTKIIKDNWKFPFIEFACLFEIDNDNIDVTIENIHFQDFNGTCIGASKGNSVKICNNRITIHNGLGRGQTYPFVGDQIIGISVWNPNQEQGGFPGGVLIEGNYLDFSTWQKVGGYIPQRKENDPEFRPNHDNHETYIGNGIMVMNNLGNVVIRDNIVHNMNARGILVQDNIESSNTQITGNTVFSEIDGCYPYSYHHAGVGIMAFGSWGFNNSGSNVYISDNDVRCTKLNYCGVAIYGQSTYVEGSGKLGECVVENNRVHLEDGFVGVFIRKNDETEVYGNKISGRAYYGFHLSGSIDRKGFDLGSNGNLIEDNDLSDLVIKRPDEYSDNHVDGRMFTGLQGKAKTAHFWLNTYTRNNVVKLQENESVIDEGDNNKIDITQKK